MPSIQMLAGGEPIQAGSVYCIGRNYAAHAAELNNPVPKSPLVFLKPASSLLQSGGTVYLPESSQDVHHEVEVVVLIGESGKAIGVDDAPNYIAGVGVGVDMTARDIQSRAKEKGHPWSIAKGFDGFAPLSRMADPEMVGDLGNLALQLTVNGEVRQSGTTANMLWPIANLISYLSSIFTLYPGDLVFTGTPEGVGPVKSGDQLQAVLGDGTGGAGR